MSVSGQSVKNVYECDGVNREWGYTFELMDINHLSIYYIDNNSNLIKVENSYSIDTNNKIVTYPTVESGLAPLPSGYKLILIRETPLTQETDYDSTFSLNLKSLEDSLDKLTYIVQELKEKTDRAIVYNPTNDKPEIDVDKFTKELNSLKADIKAYRDEALNYSQQSGNYYLQVLNIYNQCNDILTQCQNILAQFLSMYGSITDKSGTLANRPQDPSYDVFYWATDIQQYFRYSTKAKKWFLIG